MTTAPMNGFNSETKWPAGAIEDWQNGGSYSWIASKYGRAYTTVAKLIRETQALGVSRVVDISKRSRRGGRRAFYDQKPLSQLHLHIGVQLGRHREIENSYSCSEFAEIIETSRLTIRKMELGLHDFSLSELAKIASVLDTSLPALMTCQDRGSPENASVTLSQEDSTS